MNDLEEAFNKIIAVEFMIGELQEAVNSDDMKYVNDVTAALTAFIPVYTANYDRASKRAWNNTVTEVAKQDNPYRSYPKTSTVTYKDVIQYLETDPHGNYVSRPEEKTED
mgnify:FL=1